MYNLFLDDVRQPVVVGNYFNPVEYRSWYRLKEWVIVRNYDEFVKTINEKGIPELISFDHDLAEIHYNPETWTESFEYNEKTGYDCALWFLEYCKNNNKEILFILIHSMNPDGKERIKSLFQ